MCMTKKKKRSKRGPMMTAGGVWVAYDDCYVSGSLRSKTMILWIDIKNIQGCNSSNQGFMNFDVINVNEWINDRTNQ